MKTKISPAILGAFVIGAFAVGILALLSFGGVSFFHKPERFVVYFDESVHGLDLGSPVKLRGVRVGRVVDVSVRYDPKLNRSLAAVVCEFDRKIVTDSSGGEIDIADHQSFQNLIDKGLRAQLGVIGLATGLLFVELDFLDPKQYPPDTHGPDPKYVEVPSIPSAISEFQGEASDILAKFRRVDFVGISVELKELLVDARRQINSVDLKGIADQWKETGKSVDELVKSPEIPQTLANLNATLTKLQGTLATLDKQVNTNGTELQKTIADARVTIATFNDTAKEAKKFVASHQDFGDDAHRALVKLADAADAVQRLADFLEANPNSVVSGRKYTP